MKTNEHNYLNSSIRLIGCLVLGLITAPVSLWATTALWDGDNYNGSWSITGGGGSSDGFGWAGTLVPNGVDDVAQFDNNSFFASGGNLYLTTDTTGTTASVQGGPVLNVTLGRIEHAGASSGRGFDLRSPSTGTATLTFDVSSGNAAIQSSTAAASENGINFDVNILLNDSLNVSVQNIHSGTKNGIIFNQLVGDGLGSNTIFKSGAGLMRFKGSAGANTFGGGVIINDGTVSAEKSGALGTGNIIIQETSGSTTAQLTIMDGISDALSSSASISLFSNSGNFATLDLGVGVNQSISGLFFDSVSQSAGTWGATGSGAANTNDDWFTGTGTLTVIPEPSSIILLGIGFGLMMILRRNRH